MKKYILIGVVFSSTQVFCQNNNSPYSIIGIGDIENSYYNRTAGLANAGVAYRSDRYIINNNPASVTGLQQQFFDIELSGRGQFISYYGTPINSLYNSSKDFAIKRLAMGTKVTKRWGLSMGLAPFSTANYGFSSFKNIQGTTTNVPAEYDGNGSVNQVYLNNAIDVTKHFSVGVNASYLFGSLNQTEILLTPDLQTSLTTDRQIYVRNFLFTYGAQYYTSINKVWDVSLGGTFSNKTSLSTEFDVKVTDNSGAILNSSLVKNDVFRLPNSSDVGFTITKNKKYTLTADYKFQEWSSTNYRGSGFSLENSSRTSVGFEISNKKQFYNALYEKTYLQAGAYYGTSYLNINGQTLNELGVTLGYGFNSFKNPLAGSVVLEIGQRGTTKNDLIRERFVNITFNIAYRDFWQTKGKKYY